MLIFKTFEVFGFWRQKKQNLVICNFLNYVLIFKTVDFFASGARETATGVIHKL